MGARAVRPVEEVLASVALWSGQDVVCRPMVGGLSHHIWLVEVPRPAPAAEGDAGKAYVLRILDPAVAAAGLGVEPDVELENTARAARSGAGAAVVEALPALGAVVLEYLPGTTLDAAAVRDRQNIPRIAQACRQLHAGPRFVNDFDIALKLHELLEICRRHELRLPPRYEERLSTVDRMRLALAVRPIPAVPCHNDLLAENFIDSGGRLRIVDYQLAGNNDPCFELGDIAAESDFDDELVELLARAYFGDELTASVLARVRLNLTMSNVTWSLWFSVHHGLLRSSAVEFDYWAEAADKWSQAERDLDSADLGRLLDTAAGRTRPAPESALLPREAVAETPPPKEEFA
jgi:thiamine kinase-like enzyme